MVTRVQCGAQSGPGVARVLGGGSIDGTFEYEENGKSLRVSWDARETGTTLTVKADFWDVPNGMPLAPESRERLFDGLWTVAQTKGIHAVVDESSSLPCLVARAWDRPAGFLVNVHDGGQLEYLELGRTLAVAYHEPVDYLAVLELPRRPRWTYPRDGAIANDEWQLLLSRLGACKASDMWIGSSLPWRIELPRSGA
jgi:hypothetical protein